jgi:MFS family permease
MTPHQSGIQSMNFSWLPPSLHYRKFRYLWFGLLVSIAGNQMQTAAVLWHVNELTDEPIFLGGVGLVRLIPLLVFSLIAGATADVVNRRRLMLITQSIIAVLSTLLGTLTFLGLDSIPVLYIIISLSSAFWAFDNPARQSLIPNLVPRETLTNAFSLASIAGKFGAIAGPALGGLVLARWGIAYAYFLNAVSFLAVIVALLLMGSVEQAVDERVSELKDILNLPSMLTSVQDGFRFVLNQPVILSSMLLDGFAMVFGSVTALLPIYTKEILGVGAQGYGILLAAPSIGAATVAVILSFVKQIYHQGRVLLLAVGAFGLSAMVFGLSRSFTLTFIALALTGLTDTVSQIIRNTIRQLQTPDHLRGRTVSINQLFFAGGPEMGQLEAGLMAQLFGPVVAVVSGSIGVLLAAGGIAIRFPELRRYQGDEAFVAGTTQVEPSQSAT